MRVSVFQKRLSSLLIPALVLGILVNEVLNTPIYSDRDLREMREAAVAEAEQGQVDTAVEKLRALSEIAPLDPMMWGDYLVVLVRAGQADEALALFAADPQRALPAYAFPELFAAAIALRKLELARQLAGLEIIQSTDRQQLAGERARSLIRAGYIDPAAPPISVATEVLPVESAGVIAPETAGTINLQPAITAHNPVTETVAANAERAEPARPAAFPEKHSAPITSPASPANAATRVAPEINSAQAEPLPARLPAQVTTSPARRVTAPAQVQPGTAVAPAKSPAAPVSAATTADVVAVASHKAAPNPAAASQAQADARIAAADEARNAVREAELAPAPQRAESAERALIALDAYAADLSAHPAAEVEIRNEQLDRVRALTLANRLEEATDLFEALGDPGLLPIFGLLYGADLYVRQAQPEQARQMLDIAQQQDASNRSVLLARFYLELDGANYSAAGQTLTQLRNTATSSLETRNDRLLGAQLAAYSDQLEAAQLELEALLAEDSSSADVHQRLALVYRWRGWPRRALTEYHKAEELVAQPESVQLGAVNTLADMHSFAEARTTLATVAENAPLHPDLPRALIEQQQRYRWEYSTQFSAGGSSDSPVTGAGAFTLEQRLLSSPFADHLRVFAHQRYDWADYPEGSASLNRVGVGIDYRSRTLDTALEVNERSHGGGLGFNLNGEWHFDDRFSLFGGMLTDNTATPLRGLRAGIKGDSYALGLLHRANERRQTRISYSLSELSDGNDRMGLSLRHTQSWFLSGRRRLNLVAEAYYGNNTASEDVAYYNPASEKVASATFEYTAPVRQNGERDWTQRLAIGSGVYHQQFFGSSAIWDIEYEQRLRIDSTFEINYGLLYRSRVYSGDREGYGALIGGMSWRF